jgi:hypothetical protein
MLLLMIIQKIVNQPENILEDGRSICIYVCVYMGVSMNVISSCCVRSACSFVAGPISSLTFWAAVAGNLAGRTRAKRGRVHGAMVRSKQEATFVAALEKTLPAIHSPSFFGCNFVSSCIDALL